MFSGFLEGNLPASCLLCVGKLCDVVISKASPPISVRSGSAVAEPACRADNYSVGHVLPCAFGTGLLPWR